MSKYLKLFYGIAISLLLSLSVVFTYNNKAFASYKGHYTTPTELRGNWYAYDNGVHKLYHMHVFKHSIYSDGKLDLSTHKHGHYNLNLLYIKRFRRGFGGNVYQLNGKENAAGKIAGAADPTVYWLSRQRVHGKRVLKSYTRQGYFYVSTRQKIHHDYSYTDLHGNTMKKLGR